MGDPIEGEGKCGVCGRHVPVDTLAQVKRAEGPGKVLALSICGSCASPDDIPAKTYEELKALLPEGYGADLVQQVEAAQMEQSLGGDDGQD